jgi:hypothetical protein
MLEMHKFTWDRQTAFRGVVILPKVFCAVGAVLMGKTMSPDNAYFAERFLDILSHKSSHTDK